MTGLTVIDTPQGLRAQDAGPEQLRLLLGEFDAKLATWGVDLDSVLAPGIEPAEVRDKLGSVGLVPPDELIVWYGWHNGLRTTADNKYLGMSPFVAHANLDWTIARYRYDIAESVPEGLWAEKWICMESDRGLSAFCSGNPDDLPLLRREDVEVFDFVEETTDHQIVSLCTMVGWWIQAIDDGAVRPKEGPGKLAWTYDNIKLMAMDRGMMFLV